MIFKHKRTGVLYRMFFDSFDVATQRPHRVYISMDTGEIFNRDLDVFHENFEFINNPQTSIEAKPKRMLEKELAALVSNIDTDVLSDTSLKPEEKLAKIRKSIDTYHEEND